MADEMNKEDASFTIENNVLKGKMIPYTLRIDSTGQYLFDVMINNPNVIGQVDGITGQEDTLANMLDRAIKCAIWMQKQGVEKGDIIATSSHNHFDSFTPCIAALFIGAIFNPWNYDMNIKIGCHFMNVTQPKVIFANKQSAGIVLEVAKIENANTKVVCFGEYPHTIPFSEVLSDHSHSAVTNFRCAEIDDPSATATILYTSGTTGLPKGAQIPHWSWLVLLTATDSTYWKKQVPLLFSSSYWITNVMMTLNCISTCTKKIIVPEFDPKTACEIIQNFKVTWALISTGSAGSLIRYSGLHDYDLSSLNVLCIVGSVMKAEFHDMIKKILPDSTVVLAYGMTEFGGVVTVPSPINTSGTSGMIGRNSEMKIVDLKTRNVLGPNQNGELYVKSPTMMKGYYKNPEATKAIIDEEGWIHTGDLAHYNEKGEIFIVDRLKEIIKYRGRQIPPTEIEAFLQSHPAVLEAAVVGVPHPTDDEHPVAFVNKAYDKEVTEQELMDMVANNFMDHYKLRGGIHFVSSLPYTHSGKILRAELKAIAKDLFDLKVQDGSGTAGGGKFVSVQKF